MKKKIVVFLLAFVMLIGNISGIAFANSTGNTKVYRVKEIMVPYSGTYNPIVEGLRIRKTPGLSGRVLGMLYPGDYLTVQHGADAVYKDGYEWVMGTRQSDGLSGWVVFSYLEEIG